MKTKLGLFWNFKVYWNYNFLHFDKLNKHYFNVKWWDWGSLKHDEATYVVVSWHILHMSQGLSRTKCWQHFELRHPPYPHKIGCHLLQQLLLHSIWKYQTEYMYRNLLEKTRPLSVIKVIHCPLGVTFGLIQILYAAFIQVLLLGSVM